jgi:hypothetical protein
LASNGVLSGTLKDCLLPNTPPPTSRPPLPAFQLNWQPAVLLLLLLRLNKLGLLTLLLSCSVQGCAGSSTSMLMCCCDAAVSAAAAAAAAWGASLLGTAAAAAALSLPGRAAVAAATR